MGVAELLALRLSQGISLLLSYDTILERFRITDIGNMVQVTILV